MRAEVSSDPDVAIRQPEHVGPSPIEQTLRIERHDYAPAPANRIFGFAGTSLIFGVVLSGLILNVQQHFDPPPPSSLLVVNLLPLASPPVTPPRSRGAPKPAQNHLQTPELPKAEPILPTIAPSTPLSMLPPSPVATPAPPRPETAAPERTPTPPAPQVSSNATDSWEGRVLARLQKVQRYPGAARNARQQGVAYIQFRMNRAGHILSSSLMRSSGFPALDQAALDTLHRADPLPEIPPERPDQIELVVPVEFYLR